MSAFEAAVLLATAIAAATVTGALGYGFSSLLVPVALTLRTSRVLNPALVLAEIPLNLAALYASRRSVPKVWRHVLPLLIGAVPGIALGSWALTGLPSDGLKLATFALLLPLLLLQTAGIRRPLPAEPRYAVPAGVALGALYATTTLCGPPLALVLNNQGLAKDDFRAAMALIRVVEASVTAVAYLALGLFSAESLSLSALFLPAIVIGIPLGRALVQRVQPESFRRICMAVDAGLVSFGLARMLVLFAWVPTAAAVVLVIGALAAEAWLLRGYFRGAAVTQSSPVTHRILATETEFP